jgi:hypothetical protein
MPSIEHQICKQAAAGTRDITLTIPGTLEIIRKPEGLQASVSLWQNTTLDFLTSMV